MNNLKQNDEKSFAKWRYFDRRWEELVQNIYFYLDGWQSGFIACTWKSLEQ